MKKVLGGNRLGAGRKNEVEMKGYGRSTHDLGYIWRSSMSAGTLVPCMFELALPGDTFDIDLDVDVKTHPTIGPLFGGYKIQTDVFQIPIRLYIKALHNNENKIGLDMSKVKLPLLQLAVGTSNGHRDNDQVDPSTLLAYMGIRGVGRSGTAGILQRNFNAIPLLGYWDTYKNYYANKQEEMGAMVHRQISATDQIISLTRPSDGYVYKKYPETQGAAVSDRVLVKMTGGADETKLATIVVNTDKGIKQVTDIWQPGTYSGDTYTSGLPYTPILPIIVYNWGYAGVVPGTGEAPEVTMFPLSNIDAMRDQILTVATGSPMMITKDSALPFSSCLQHAVVNANELVLGSKSTQQGLALKTYQSDLFNNWMKTEYIDGQNGINEITSVDTSDGKFTIDALRLATKVNNMLNRIMLSGGTYDEYIETVYDHNVYKRATAPIYLGGLSKELMFQEVVSNSAAGTEEREQPLGTLAGKGVMTGKHKGGKVSVRVDEPSYIMTLISITPRVDYSQGNKWDMNLKTIADFHRPELDEIGFQDLITDQMAYWDTVVNGSEEPVFQSAGKQPAWMNYMTNVNRTYGNFAIADNEMFMTLNRQYAQREDGIGGITDLTTYIDPAKFNNIFAATQIDAQNFWVQVGVDMTVRRKMSSKVMPNL